MGWVAWLICTVAVGAIGGRLMQKGTTHVAKYSAIACAVLFLMTLFKFGHLFGPTFAPIPWFIFSALAPATIFFVIYAAKRDRALVMGPSGSRDATASAAIMHGAGAGAMYEAGGAGGGGGMES